MRTRLPGIALALALAVLPSCKTVQSIIHDDEVVAKLGNHKLYRADLEGIVPAGTSSEDSLNLVNLFINSWATDMAFQDIAQQRLSKEEKDISKEMEAYRQSLLRYRFEQHYVAERLDTNVSRKEIEDYYEAHKSSFKLQRPILKARFLNIAKDSPSLPEIKRLMSSDDPADVEAADSAAFGTAQRYRDFSANWIDAVTLAAEFGVDYVEMLSRKKGSLIEIPDGEANVSVAYVSRMVGAGETAPVAYCEDRIKDIILSGRKHELLTTLEQELIEEAKLRENFVIY
ncbi:MAG: hypothetical protein J6Z47_07810 [Bacteroidales bacterium]|nr:hypothetical protein [Bacteroidales bacterium]